MNTDSEALRRRKHKAPQTLDLIRTCLAQSSVLQPIRDQGYQFDLVPLERGVRLEARRGAERIQCEVSEPLWWDRVGSARIHMLSQRLALRLNQEWEQQGHN